MPKHPENLKDLRSVDVTGEIKSYVVGLSNQIDDARNERKNLEQAVDRLHRLRYGVRPKKTHPWPGAANYSIPLIDTDIARIKPSYVNLAFAVSPIVTFEPYGAEDVDPAKKREMLFDWRMRTQVDFFMPYNYGLDMVLGAQGQTIFRTIWKYTTRTYYEELDLEELDERILEAIYDPRVDDELLFRIIQEELDIDIDFEENIKAIDKAIKQFRDGKTSLKMTLLEVDEDKPEVTACDPFVDLTVPYDTKDINDARLIDYKYWVSKNDLKIAIRDEKYEAFSDSEIDSWAKGERPRVNSHAMTSTGDNDMVLMHETCCWYDVDGDGIEDRCIVTWPDASPESVLRFIELPYDHGQWPYVQIKRELTDSHFYSTRGIPSLDEDFQVGVSTAVNQAIDNGTLTNTPVQVARKGVISNPRNRRFVPGEFVETNGATSDYELRQSVNASQPILFQQAQFLKSFSDARHGQQTSGLSSQTDLAGMGQGGKKTAREVDAIMQLQGQAQSLDLQVFQQQMAKVYYQIDALYWQFGSDEEEIAITGQAPIRVSRDEIQGKFNIVPNGRLDNSSPQMRLQKTMTAFNIGFQNPYVRQKELIQEVYKNLDQRYAQIFLKDDEELAQEQQQQMQMIQGQLAQQVNLRKISDDLDVRKEMLLEPIQGKKFAAD